MLNLNLRLPLVALLILLMCTPAASEIRTETTSTTAADTATTSVRQQMLQKLVKQVPEILKSQDKATGRWGSGIWIVNDQHPMWALAVAWATPGSNNPYYHNPEVLKAIVAAGDALLTDADKNGQWVFRKKDGSTWGKIYMPWTYTRWMRAYSKIREALPAEKRSEWDAALKRAYTNIATKELGHIHNIPTYHALGLYVAGETFDREDWKTTASAFLRKVAQSQDPAGFWSENNGPVIGYGAVYISGLGAYYGISQDDAVLPALKAGTEFLSQFTWPDGTAVYDIDERQTYSPNVSSPLAEFYLTPEGRGFAQRQVAFLKGTKLSSDVLANIIDLNPDSSVKPWPEATESRQFLSSDSKAYVRTLGQWSICYSAYHCPVPGSRWIQDRQNLVGLFLDGKGQLMGGGNTKLTPMWSTFTAGDISLLQNKGEEDPDYSARPGLLHTPTSASIDASGYRLNLEYGDAKVHVQTRFTSGSDIQLVYAVDEPTSVPVTAHLPLLPRLGKDWETAAGEKGQLTSATLKLSADQIGTWFRLDGVTWHLPQDATISWPEMMYNQYAKHGESEPAKGGRLVISLPFERSAGEKVVTVSTATR